MDAGRVSPTEGLTYPLDGVGTGKLYAPPESKQAATELVSGSARLLA